MFLAYLNHIKYVTNKFLRTVCKLTFVIKLSQVFAQLRKLSIRVLVLKNDKLLFI